MLPSTYQKVQYIQTSGTQYINTGFNPNQNTRVVLDYAVVSAPTSPLALFGGRNDTTVSCFDVWIENMSGLFPQYNNNSYNSNKVSYSYSVGTKVRVDFNKNVCSMGGASASFTAATFQATSPIGIGAIISGGNADSRMSSIRIYACQIYNNGIMVRNLIPCYRKSDSVIGLYDDVNGTFYVNKGRGSFTKGSDVNAVTYKTVINGAINAFNNIQNGLSKLSDLGIGAASSNSSENVTAAEMAAAISKCAVIKISSSEYKTGKVSVYDPSVDA